MMKASTPLAALFVVLGLIGCSGSDSSSSESSPAKRPEPVIALPQGPPPKKLVIVEVEKGSGRKVKRGDQVTVRWMGVQYRSGEIVGSSWREHHTFTFETNAGRVIPGWDRGVIGMRVGGRRKLIIPPPLAYEDTGTTSVPPNETLIYVVDLLAVEPAAGGGAPAPQAR